MVSRHLGAVWLTLALLQGCTTPVDKPPVADSPIPAAISSYDQAIELARRAPPDRKASFLLRAMAIALETGNVAQASAAAQLINPTLLSVDEGLAFEKLAQKQAQLSGTPVLSDTYLLSLTALQLEKLPVATRARAIGLRADQLLQAGQPIEAAALRVSHRGLFLDGASRRNQDAIWSALRQVPAYEIMVAGGTTEDPEMRGWLDLAGRIQQQRHLDGQLQVLGEWMRDHPGHSAASVMPGELALLQQMPTYRPQRMALLLPLSGTAQKAGEAIRDGFIAGYLQSDPDAVDSTEIQIIDASGGTDIAALYASLQLQPLDIIVGPLDKDQVDALARLPEHPTPTLALNYVSDSGTANSPFYQFGLSSEDEIDQILGESIATGKTRLLIIAHGAAWADKLLNYLQGAATERGIDVLGVERVADESQLSAAIEEQLNISESKLRFKNVQSLTGKLDGDPRRRRDVDSLLIIAPPQFARQIKPLLAFHYAGDLPVYATSHVTSGQTSVNKDQDLDGIRLPETPWVLARTLDIKASSEKYLPVAYGRFFAMGLDSYQLAARLKLMQSFPDTVLQGQTGELYLNGSGQIRRRLEWAEFRQGSLVAAPSSSPSR